LPESAVGAFTVTICAYHIALRHLGIERRPTQVAIRHQVREIASLYSTFPVVKIHDVVRITYAAIRTGYVLHPPNPRLLPPAILQDAPHVPGSVLAGVHSAILSATILTIGAAVRITPPTGELLQRKLALAFAHHFTARPS